MTQIHMIDPEHNLELIVIGEVNADVILERVNNLPALGKERTARGLTITMGSSSAILAANAGALGVSVGFVGRTGDDMFGHFMRERLGARGVDTSRMIDTPEDGTGLTVIFTRGRERGMITYPGAMKRLTIQDIPWEYLSRARHLHVSSYYLQTGLRPDCRELFRKARELGLSTSLDTNWDPDETWGKEVLDVLEFVDVFLPNDEEARLISGTKDLDLALDVLGSRVGTVVVTCGAGGVRARQRSTDYSVTALPVSPVDAVGAGDTFNAGFLRCYIRGESIQKCLEFGTIAAAFSTQVAGGTDAFDDIVRFHAFASENASAVKCDVRRSRSDHALSTN